MSSVTTPQVLIAEDERGIASFIAKGLERRGYATTITADGREALGLARTHEFDLLILDLGLPGMDGRAVLAELRLRGARLPVVVITARGPLAAEQALEAGADELLEKPFRLSRLLAVVRRLLRTQPAPAAAVVNARRFPAVLAFDSWTAPRPAGVRGTVGLPPDRHLVAESRLADVALDVSALPDGRYRLHGQLFPRLGSGQEAVEARIDIDGSQAAAADIDAFGVFSFRSLPAGRYGLSLCTGTGEVVVAPFDMPDPA